jgi:ABC-type uncharacterized transport system auxiliary subunit
MKLSSLIFLSILTGLTGCMSQQAVIQKHYTIENPGYQDNVTPDSIQVIPVSCEIEQVEISPVYDRNQIVNRSDSHEISYYKYHQWAVKPSLAVMELIKNYLEKANLFKSVSTRYNRDIPNYRFTTAIHQLEVVEIQDQFSAHVTLEFCILNNANNRVLLQHEADRIVPLSEKNLNLFARAVSEILYTELEKFAGTIRDQRKELEELADDD